MIGLQQVINSSLSLRIASACARAVPPRLGYRLAAALAEQIGRRREAGLVQALRLNQWIAHGEALEREALDLIVRKTLQHSARCLFDLYHYSGDAAATRRMIVLEPSFQQITRRPEFAPRGLVIVGMHLSNFDLIMQWVCREGLKPLALTLPNPQGGRRLEYEIRKKTGMNIVPTSVAALRRAIRHLEQGGMVVTGIDRPIPNPELCPHFFGRPAALPVHHIFLAMKAQVPVVVAAANLQSDDRYHVFASDLIEMDAGPQTGLLCNAEKVLAVAEQFIKDCPEQWCVPLPVWPQVMDLVPK